MDYQLDVSMMFAMHDALRRELVQVAHVASRSEDHPGKLLRAALGWELFKKFLLVHHQSEDDTLWPALRTNGASPQMLDAVLGKFPPPLLTAFREQWGPKYAALDIWPAVPERA
jgi:hypothetical protein